MKNLRYKVEVWESKIKKYLIKLSGNWEYICKIIVLYNKRVLGGYMLIAILLLLLSIFNIFIGKKVKDKNLLIFYQALIRKKMIWSM